MGAGCSSSTTAVAPFTKGGAYAYAMPAPVKADAIRLGAGVDIVANGGQYHESVPIHALTRKALLAHYQPPEFPPVPVIGPHTHELTSETWKIISTREYADPDAPADSGKRCKGYVMFYKTFFRLLFNHSAEFKVKFPTVHLQAGVMAKVIATCLRVSYTTLDAEIKVIAAVGRLHQPLVDAPYLYAAYACNLHRALSLCLLPSEATVPRMTAWLHVLAFVLLHMLPTAVSDAHIRLYSGQQSFPMNKPPIIHAPKTEAPHKSGYATVGTGGHGTGTGGHGHTQLSTGSALPRSSTTSSTKGLALATANPSPAHAQHSHAHTHHLQQHHTQHSAGGGLLAAPTAHSANSAHFFAAPPTALVAVTTITTITSQQTTATPTPPPAPLSLGVEHTKPTPIATAATTTTTAAPTPRNGTAAPALPGVVEGQPNSPLPVSAH